MSTYSKQTAFIIMMLCFLFGIAEIILAEVRSNDCNLIDSGTNLSPKSFLVGAGIVDIIKGSGILICLISKELAEMINITCIICLILLFNIIWFIIGAVILFRSNIECINEGSLPAISALVAWLINLWMLFCLKTKDDTPVKKENDEEQKAMNNPPAYHV
jgi:hypothetical protein